MSEERESKLFPEQGRNNDNISCHALTPDFLIICTDMGGISYFFLEDWTTVHEFRHVFAIDRYTFCAYQFPNFFLICRHMAGIKQIEPEPNGTKCIVVDAKTQGYVYNPVDDEFTLIKGFPDKVKKILWDFSITDKDVFVTFDGEQLTTFLVNGDDPDGPSCSSLGTTRVPSGQHPVLLFGGEVSLQTQSGKLVKLTLTTHEISPNISEYSNDDLRSVLQKNVALGRLRNAWAICQVKPSGPLEEHLSV